jgi:hypothetical protein
MTTLTVTIKNATLGMTTLTVTIKNATQHNNTQCNNIEYVTVHNNTDKECNNQNNITPSVLYAECRYSECRVALR